VADPADVPFDLPAGGQPGPGRALRAVGG